MLTFNLVIKNSDRFFNKIFLPSFLIFKLNINNYQVQVNK